MTSQRLALLADALDEYADWLVHAPAAIDRRSILAARAMAVLVREEGLKLAVLEETVAVELPL